MNNIDVYMRKNVKVYCDDYLDICHRIKQDVIFIDPPWGGSEYRSKVKMDLFLSGEPLSAVLNRLSKYAYLIVVKTPCNLDLGSIFCESYFKSFSVHKIRNYLLLIFKT